LLSIMERISPKTVLEDNRRLADFLKRKHQKSKVVSLIGQYA
jgi:hypothetical protein